METITLLMPALNEIEALRVVLPQIDRGLFDEIIVVDGYSTDGTAAYCESQGVKVLQQPGKGYPDALRHGFLNSKGDIVVSFTPDGNSLPECLGPLCAKMREGYDLVIVSRYLDGARSADDTLFTGLGNFIAPRLTNLLYGSTYTDVLVGYRAYRRSAVERMRLHAMHNGSFLRRHFDTYLNSWDPGSSYRAARLKLRVGEIPGDEPRRIGGRSKLILPLNGAGVLLQMASDFLFFGRDST